MCSLILHNFDIIRQNPASKHCNPHFKPVIHFLYQRWNQHLRCKGTQKLYPFLEQALNLSLFLNWLCLKTVYGKGVVAPSPWPDRPVRTIKNLQGTSRDRDKYQISHWPWNSNLISKLVPALYIFPGNNFLGLYIFAWLFNQRWIVFLF